MTESDHLIWSVQATSHNLSLQFHLFYHMEIFYDWLHDTQIFKICLQCIKSWTVFTFVYHAFHIINIVLLFPFLSPCTSVQILTHLVQAILAIKFNYDNCICKWEVTWYAWIVQEIIRVFIACHQLLCFHPQKLCGNNYFFT